MGSNARSERRARAIFLSIVAGLFGYFLFTGLGGYPYWFWGGWALLTAVLVPIAIGGTAFAVAKELNARDP